jgi:soluble lytic murein transglycosylase-like protein
MSKAKGKGAVARIAIALLATTPEHAVAQVLEIAPDGTVTQLGAPVPESAAPTRSCAQDELRSAFQAAARRYDLSVDLLVNVASTESNCAADAVSPAGAVGVMQLMPGTARELGVDPANPVENIFGGAAYLRQQLDRFDGRLDLALAAYNAGPEAVARHNGVPAYAETRRYVERNLDLFAAQSLSQSGAMSP